MRKTFVKLLSILTVSVLSLGAFSACGKKTYKDGTYTGQSEVYIDDSEEGNGYGVVTLTIEGGVITECEFLTYEPDGTLKDENYGTQNGEVANEGFYTRAQRALAGSREYARLLVETQDYHSIDAISGATISYGQFMEAVDNALSQAEA
ncbi:MAG: FMN-binding protein [Clostridiales bacterium]|nr:FMN-binding protein [Clostridiales bacterium]